MVLEAPDEDPLILDLGTGLRFFGITRKSGDPFRGTALVSHLHWDHVQGLPFFAPVLAVVQDVRWGRTYESFGEDTATVAELGAAYIRGLQDPDDAPRATDHGLSDPATVLATPKHFIGDGATLFGSSTQNILDTIPGPMRAS